MADKEYSYETRRRSYYGHQYANLRAREKLEAAGVKDKSQLPVADYREPSAQKAIKAGAKKAKPITQDDLDSHSRSAAMDDVGDKRNKGLRKGMPTKPR